MKISTELNEIHRVHEDLIYTFRDDSLDPTLSPQSKSAGTRSDKHASFNIKISALTVSMKFKKSAAVFSSNWAASPHDARIFSLNFRIYFRQFEDSIGVRINYIKWRFILVWGVSKVRWRNLLEIEWSSGWGQTRRLDNRCEAEWCFYTTGSTHPCAGQHRPPLHKLLHPSSYSIDQNKWTVFVHVYCHLLRPFHFAETAFGNGVAQLAVNQIASWLSPDSVAPQSKRKSMPCWIGTEIHPHRRCSLGCFHNLHMEASWTARI